ncbi:ty3-gypsy retrotransposon protein [Cucumis melo var. makuwa]|uniref:Ty3-gypsy retrotransposon protein n=1 Tax=Cucumis melo var. makuwa TaxID=1194695 RepID=A0A5A7UB01_CUCMM|nr:ty3-gypsy retrotransposon protein [Cucumis melo var. makuwa]TYJ95498.1 ty3-gypsy retrotransposon protein [Cucumis melo var. makuwa]
MANTVLRHSPGKMPSRRGGTGVREARRIQPDEQSAPPTDAQTSVEPQIVSDQLSAEAEHLRDFRKYNPKTFDGSMDDPTKAQMWLTSVETIFRYMKCPNDQKVQCAIFFLTDRGTAWWETAERMLGSNVNHITWEQFKESFYEKFFSTSMRSAKQQEFLNLKKDNMTVEQYGAEFDILSRFAPDVVRNEAIGTDKFVSSLKQDLKGFVQAFRPTTHADALRLAMDMSLHERADLFKAAERGSIVTSLLQQEGLLESYLPVVAVGDLMDDTPTSQQGSVFATTRHEAKQAGTVVTCMLPILGHFAFVLFDSGSSHSFISSIFVQHLCLEVKPLSSILYVSTPSGEVILSKEKIKACQVEVANHVLDVTLLVLDIRDFDVILVMDWLSANHASIDCSRKEVLFNPPLTINFKFKGAGTVVLPKVISAMIANKLLSQGTWSILASVVDTREPEVSLSSEPVVREYPNVLPDELPGLPPPNEIDFSIELKPSTVLIFRALYRIASTELKELKDTFVIFFIDDILIYSKIEAEHKEHLHQALETLQANKLYAKFSKCYYRRFVENFSRIASPLTELTRKVTPFIWSPACESSFQELKKKLVTGPVFIVPDGSESFVIYSDASKKGLGCVLMQQGKVVAYASQGVEHEPEKMARVRKADMVADALSWKVSHSTVLIIEQAPLLRDFERAEIAISLNDPYMVEKRRLAEAGQDKEFSISSDDGLMFERCLCVPADSAYKDVPGLEAILLVAKYEERSGRLLVDKLTKSTHFIPRKSTYTTSKWGQLYMTEIVRLHGVPVSIVSDRDARFTSKFWKGLQFALGTMLDFSTVFHPQTNGQTERLNQIFEDMLLPLAWHRLKLCMAGVIGLLFVGRRKDERRKNLKFDVRDMNFFKVAPMKDVLRFEKKGKLSPRFVGPFEILERIGLMLRNRGTALVKVLWRNHGAEEATWERDDDMRP